MAARQERNGLFASHPVTRIASQTIEKEIDARSWPAKATVEPRYKQFITFDAKPITEIAADVEGAAGLASGDKKKDDDKKADATRTRRTRPRRRAFGLSSITGNKQAQAEPADRVGRRPRRVPDRDARAARTRTRSA